jgi:hypothetical protein
MRIFFDKKYRPWIEEALNVLNDIVFRKWGTRPEIRLFDEDENEIFLEVNYADLRYEGEVLHEVSDLVEAFLNGFISARDKSFSDSFKA